MNYKYYLVQDPDALWTYGIFTDYEKARDFIVSLCLPGFPVLEIFGTNENPDTYLPGDTLLIYNPKTDKIQEVKQ